jgi:prepilin-type N-terminal cleavage/methylation domain-containing protein
MRHTKLLILGALVVALLLIGFTATAMAANPQVTITVTKWNVPPLAPTHFEIEQTALHSINITWTKGTAANITIVRGDISGYPFSIFDGDAIYSGNGTYVEVDSLDFNTYTYYYRAWSQNEYGTSTGYAQASVGDTEEDDGTSEASIFTFSLGDGFGLLEMMLVIAIMGFAFWKKSWIRVTLSVCLIIWGAFAMPYDIKVAAPLIGIGTVLFIMGILNLIGQSRETREES